MPISQLHRLTSTDFAPSVPTASDAVTLLRLWLRRSRTRRDLESLTPSQMRDLGLNPAMVRRERDKPFWRA